MKQQITTKQLNELSDFGKGKLRKWCVKKKYGKEITEKLKWEGGSIIYWKIPLLSIGQMVEFLDKDGLHITRYKRKDADYSWEILVGESSFLFKELCDALWEAVKEILEK